MKVITIGREKNNDIVINDVKVSRNHLQIAQDDNGCFTVVDLDSTNGTFVNDTRINGAVPLKSGDKVRIGNMTLPWQNYFETKQQPLPSSPQPVVDRPTKPSRTTWYVVGAIVLLLLIGGGVTYKIFNDKKRAKIEAESVAKAEEIRLQREEVQQKDAKARQLKIEADSLLNQALRSNNAEAQRLAEMKQREANAAKSEASIAIAAQSKAERQRDDALEAKQTAEDQRAEADRKAREEREERQRADTAAAQANAERLRAETETKLVRQFYEIFPQIKVKASGKDYPKIICEKLGITLTSETTDLKSLIKIRFDNADNNQKQVIVNTVRNVLGQQKDDEEADKSNDSIPKPSKTPTEN